MLFDLKSVFQNEGETKSLDYELDMSAIDVDGVFPFIEPVRVSAVAGNRASLVELVLTCRFSYSRVCDRCGEDASKNLEPVFTHRLVKELADESNDDYIETPDLTVELDDIVISDILLSLPQKNLCREDCKGLCLSCGQNLNYGSCDCKRRAIDPRLEILKQFMDE